MTFKPLKRLIIPAILVLCFSLVLGLDYEELRVNGTSGAYFIEELDTADTGGGGSLVVVDTFLSDIYDVDTLSKYLHYEFKLLKIDTGSEVLDDSTGDLVIVWGERRSSTGGPWWRISADTFTDIDSGQYNFVIDTTVFNQFRLKTIIIDSLDLTGATDPVDTNIYWFYMFVQTSGTRSN